MKKLLLFLALAAAGLQGWAEDNYYLLGDATPIGWIGTNESDRTPTKMQPTGNANEYAWTGLLKTANNGFKICKNNSWNGYRATSDQEVLVYDADIPTQDNNDYKWKVEETNYCYVTLNTSTSKIRVHKLVPANDEGTCLIGTESHLTEFRKLVNDNGMTSLNAELTADITLSGSHTPIGTDSKKFSGTFDGKKHKIINLLITGTGDAKGFFGETSGATIKDVEFLKANVNITSGKNTGVVVGVCDNTTIQRCAVVNSYLSGNDHTGSIAGCAKGNSTISNCYSNAKVVSVYQAGGMVGTSEGMTIEHCLFMGPSIEGTYSGHGGARGLISLLEGDGTTMKHNVVAAQYVYSGGGSSYCQSLVSQNGKTLTVDDNYSWSTTRYGNASSNQTYGLNSNDVNGYQKAPGEIDKTFFEGRGFDFNDDWKMVEGLTYAGGSYPILKWMTAPAASIEISTDQELYDFATFGWDNVNVNLTGNIDYSATAYQGQDAMIGTSFSRVYAGTFDGKNNTVKVGFNNTSAENSGLFCQVNGATIKNLKVEGNITTNKKFAGGICAKINNKATITNCESNVTITDNRSENGDGTHGGIVALVQSHGGGVEISNCLFSGAISASKADGCGGVVGWTSGGSSEVTIKNCLITGTMTVRTDGANDIIARSGANESNNYYTCTITGISNAENASEASAKKETGELCYLLNESTQGGTNWTQTIGTDACPIPFNTQRLVYLNGSTYANNYIKDGKYQISNANELVDFAALVNTGNASLEAELTADIDMSSVSGWTPIGQDMKDFAGHFNGQGHRIMHLTTTSGMNNQALFGQAVGPAIIENVIIDATCTIQGAKWAAGILGHVWGDNVIIRNCGNEANVTGTDDTCAGILGCSDGKVVHISNCYNKGDISGPKWNAGICGWMGNASSTIKNCYSIGTISGDGNAPIWRYNDGLNTGNDANIWTTSSGQGSQITGSMLTDGTLCAKLGYGFRQNIGSGYPCFDQSQGFVTEIKDAGWSTQYITTSDVAIPSGIEAFAGVVNNAAGTITLVPISDAIAAGEPVVLRGAAGLYNFMPTTGASDVTNNLLGSDGTITGGDGIYALSTLGGTAPVGFYPLTDTGITIPAGKAYLNTSAGVKGFTFLFDDDATGLDAVNGEGFMVNGPIFNLAGQRIQKMQKGINIVNGKKVMVK